VEDNQMTRYSWIKSTVNDKINADAFGCGFVVVGVLVLM
jgi:hypothetical protein